MTDKLDDMMIWICAACMVCGIVLSWLCLLGSFDDRFFLGLLFIGIGSAGIYKINKEKALEKKYNNIN